MQKMKILWFTNTPSNASAEFGYNVFGGGWISSLETLVAQNESYELGICFFYNGNEFRKIKKGNVVYYGFPLSQGNAFRRIINRHLARLHDNDDSFFDKVLDEFRPDLIHVFGTEMGYGRILMNRHARVVFHLQGLVAPYADVFFPPGLTPGRILARSSFSSILRGLTIVDDYRTFRKRADREIEIINYWKNFTGRTEWDKNYITLLNPHANYYHCDELLRKEFFEGEWTPPVTDAGDRKLVIATTINPNLYNGLDLVYNSMQLLGDHDIEWNIFGVHENDELSRIVRKILGTGSGKVKLRFHGQVCARDLVTHLMKCHLFVHPSYIDNSPNSVCEAMLLGMPVVSSAVGGIRTLIRHNETGFLFNPYDRYDLAGTIADLAASYDKAVKAGAGARKEALIRHSPERIMSQLAAVYDNMMNGAPEVKEKNRTT